MAKFLVKASYTPEGAKGLLKEGGTSRRATIQKLVQSMGGSMEAFYYTYGQDDVIVICDFADPTGGLALSLAANASGAVHLTTTPLISPEEVDAACKKAPAYRIPGA